MGVIGLLINEVGCLVLKTNKIFHLLFKNFPHIPHTSTAKRDDNLTSLTLENPGIAKMILTSHMQLLYLTFCIFIHRNKGSDTLLYDRKIKIHSLSSRECQSWHLVNSDTQMLELILIYILGNIISLETRKNYLWSLIFPRYCF